MLDYNLGFKLGGKGNTKCYLGTKAGKNYCVKTIEISRNEMDKRKKIEMEIEALERVKDHPNIIKYVESTVLEMGEKEIHCIVTDLMKMNLAQYVESKGGRLKEKTCRKILKKIFSAMEYSHENLIAHQDMKMENVMIDEKHHVKVVDYGMAYIAKDEQDMKNVKEIVGTPYYVSPEKFSFMRYDARKSDMWSIGILMYRMYHGCFPFDPRKNDMNLLAEMICEHEYTEQLESSDEFSSLLKSLLSKDPSSRPTATEALQHPFFKAEKQNRKLYKSLLLSFGSENKTQEFKKFLKYEV